MAANVQLYVFECGRLVADKSMMIEGGTGKIELPIMSCLIHHSITGWWLVDTGMHPDCQHHRTTPKRLLDMFEFRYGRGEDVASRLADVGVSPKEISYVVNTHLHFDHAGGNSFFRNAICMMAREEIRLARDQERGARLGFNARDVDVPFPWPLHGKRREDLAHDESIVVVPTPGHTPGHQSLKLRLRDGEILLTGDACYFCETLQRRALPRFCYDEQQFRNSLEVIADCERAGVAIAPGHDVAFWDKVPKSHGKLNPVTIEAIRR